MTTRQQNAQDTAAPDVEFKLNGKTVAGLAGETIIQAAKRHGIEIPHLCHKEGLRPAGNCRACAARGWPGACSRGPTCPTLRWRSTWTPASSARAACAPAARSR